MVNSSRRSVGKNQPCPCGSGRKYKLCCVARENQRRIVTSSIHKCECGAPVQADFSNNSLFQAFNYTLPLRHFAREAKLYLFSTLTGTQEEALSELLARNALTREALIDAYRATVKRPVAMRLLTTAANTFSVFRRRHDIIREAVCAHYNGKYALSIPVLFAQLEGIIGDYAGKRTGPPAIDVEGYDRRLAFEVQDQAREFNAFLSDIFEGHAPDDAFNRNSILHGANLGYAREDWSLVSVLTVLELHFFFWFREKLDVVVP